ncbi:hypothetical protein BKA93DRAFT_499651 [Sparassis latifolia]
MRPDSRVTITNETVWTSLFDIVKNFLPGGTHRCCRSMSVALPSCPVFQTAARLIGPGQRAKVSAASKCQLKRVHADTRRPRPSIVGLKAYNRSAGPHLCRLRHSALVAPALKWVTRLLHEAALMFSKAMIVPGRLGGLLLDVLHRQSHFLYHFFYLKPQLSLVLSFSHWPVPVRINEVRNT